MSVIGIIKQHIQETISSYKMTKANLPVRAELANVGLLIDKLNKNNGWISTDCDSLKEYANKCILIYTKSGCIKKAMYSVDDSPFTDDNGKEYAYSHWFSDEFGDFMWEFDEVDFWQPLPKPPKE